MPEKPAPAALTPPHVWAQEPWSTDLALRIATEAHAGVKDKIGVEYIEHPKAVAALVAAWGPVYEQVALLHDVVEDTAWTLQMLAEAGAPADVVAGVDSMTKRPPGQETRPEAIHRAGRNAHGRVGKAADNAHNGSPQRLAAIEDEATRRRLTRKYQEDRAILDQYDAPHFTL